MLAIIFLEITNVSHVYANNIQSDQMLINSIPLKNVTDGSIGDQKVEFGKNKDAKYVLYTDTNEFQITLLGEPLSKVLSSVERDFLKELQIAKNEACFLDVDVLAPSYIYSQQDNFSSNLSFCSSPTQQDLNDDSEVNGVDFGQCIADYETSDEAETAFDKLTKREAFTLSTGQTLESLNELDLPCDFNVNRRIDALDLSKVIEAIKSPTSPSK